MWQDLVHMSCDEYSAGKWCTSDGQYGKGWDERWKHIEDPKWIKNSMSGWNCPQCGCIGMTYLHSRQKEAKNNI